MDYKNYTIIELKEIAEEREINFAAKVLKGDLILLLKEYDEENKQEPKEFSTRDELIEDIKEEIASSKISVNIDEVKVINKVSHAMIELARNNKNMIDDVTIDVNLISELGSNYNKLVFAKVERLLTIKNVDITYSSEKLRDEILMINSREEDEIIGDEEINYSIDNLLKGIGKKQENDEVKNFLSTINDYPLLSQEKELELGKAIAQHHQKVRQNIDISFMEAEQYEDARELLSLSNKRLVISVAKKYVNRGMDLIDLIMEGMLGLQKAILKYDYSTGFKFSTYATWWVRQGITRAIADKSKVIRIPVHMVETINKVTKVQRELTQQLGQEPTFEEIGEHTIPKMTVEEVEHIFNIAKDPIALEIPIGDDNSSLESFIEDDKHLSQDQESERAELKRKLLEIIDEIPEREGVVILYRYGLYELDVEPLKRKVKFLNEVLKMLSRDVINSIQAQTIIENSDSISHRQRMKYAKRIAQNSEKLAKKYEDLNFCSNRKDRKSQERKEKIIKSIDLIKENNIAFIERIIENCQEQIDILIKIDVLTEGVIKPLTLEEVGHLFEVTRERIRQIETKGKRKLKAFADKEQLRLYLHE